MRKLCLMCVVSIVILSSCGREREKIAQSKTESKIVFRDEVRLKTTPVKNQGSSSLCWVYAMLATIETEHLMLGDSVNLSADYIARCFISEQAARRLLSNNESNTTTRGMAGMAIDLLETNGLHHYDAYHLKQTVDYGVLCRKIDCITTAPARNNFNQRMDAVNELLDKSIGFLPRKVFFRSAIYTPYEFARSVCRKNEYLGLTSFTHHPFGERFALELPDNYFHNIFLNIPLDSMMMIVENSLRAGHPVCWEGDVSEPGFSFAKGIAILPTGTKCNQTTRQKAFENKSTTDDHCMSIIGLARDTNGTKYFICKNSWGESNPYGGFMYLSHDYVKLKTIALYVQSNQMGFRK